VSQSATHDEKVELLPALRLRCIAWAAQGEAQELPALHLVRELCEDHTSTLRIIHVVESPGASTGGRLGRAREERRVATLKLRTTSLRLRGIDASLHVVRGVRGLPAPAIADFAVTVDADLLVVSVGDHRAGHEPLQGSVSRLLEHAPCPVLAVGAGPRRHPRG
jgi:nucleotide-binding universal stress UspA family protein